MWLLHRGTCWLHVLVVGFEGGRSEQKGDEKKEMKRGWHHGAEWLWLHSSEGQLALGYEEDQRMLCGCVMMVCS